MIGHAEVCNRKGDSWLLNEGEVPYHAWLQFELRRSSPQFMPKLEENSRIADGAILRGQLEEP